MASIILTLPILAGKVHVWHRFVHEIAVKHKAAHAAARLRQGVTRERVALLETPYGATSVTTFEADDVNQALNDMLTSPVPFDHWYRTQVEVSHGITLAEAVSTYGFVKRYEQFFQPVDLSDHQQLLFEWISPEINVGR